jgi:predicted dehydrogenase
LKKVNASIKYIASSGGLSSTIMAKKHGITNSTTDYHEMLKDSEVDLVFVTTQHNMHSKMALDVMKAGKSVFVEKPLALTQEELDQIIETHQSSDVNVSVGFNRRFAPLAQKMKKLIGDEMNPINVVATMNAGFIPKDVWVHDMEVGGGRIIGEACHYIDLCSYLTGSKVVSVCMNAMGVNPEDNTDNASILLKYENGSNAVINYFANGSKSYSKERVEVYSQERTLVMDNWRKLKGYGFKGFSSKSSKQDKGHFNQFKALINQQINGGLPIISFDEIINTTRASFSAIESLRQGKWISIG